MFCVCVFTNNIGLPNIVGFGRSCPLTVIGQKFVICRLFLHLGEASEIS